METLVTPVHVAFVITDARAELRSANASQPSVDQQGFELPDPNIIMNDSYWERFTILPNGCWETSRKGNPNGYVYTNVGSSKNYYVHRVSFARYHNRPIKKGYEIHHECRNRRCGNPMHLKELTRAEHISGEMAYNAKLTADQAREIYRRAWSGEKLVDIAAEFGIGQGIVSDIKHRRTWAYVTAPKEAMAAD